MKVYGPTLPALGWPVAFFKLACFDLQLCPLRKGPYEAVRSAQPLEAHPPSTYRTGIPAHWLKPLPEPPIDYMS